MAIIGLDLDGTTVIYNHAIARHIIRILGLNLTEDEFLARFPNPDTYNFTNWSDIDSFETFKKFHVDAVNNGIYRELEMFDGASAALNKLSAAGHHIRVITSRFVKGGQHAIVVADTAWSLDKNKIPYKDIMFTARKTDVFADVYIDDSPENIIAFQKADRPYIIFDALYNRHLEGPRVDNWEDCYDLLSQYPVTV